ncbi:MAG: glucosaminidase domain-containing protein [Candidatus Pseudobacter hemicellulosilyticus]|uniref:Peptidoglycan hydrolase n=1 Tax=Candidatus Pseudobacter hemicellulosilyticus TaxID=3121375 RepID=A0AAJ5WXR7_9BACT|nr:MAG: glucosaminidase domain-containing protein [Pseudobacter sp.]
MQLKRLLFVWPLLAFLGASAQRSEDIQNYIRTYKQLAIEEMQRTGVPASIKLAQGIHETMAGKSDLVLRSNNHFGIKCKTGWAGDKVYHDDDARGECFRSYSCSTDSYKDHSDFLKNSTRYAFLFSLEPTDYKGWAFGLKKAGYATNIKYSQILVKLIEDYNLQDYTLIALGRMKPEQEILADVANPQQEPVVALVQHGPSPLAQQAAAVTTTVAPAAPVSYPAGEFSINDTKVKYAAAGTSLLAVAREHNIALRRLIDFNDLKKEDVLTEAQLLFLQRKRKTGANEFHLVRPGESLYDICQTEALRLESLLDYNRLRDHEQPAVGELLYLRAHAPAKPRLAAEAALTTMAAANITIPGSRPAADQSGGLVHLVQSKETLYSIARKYDVTVEKIREWNKLPGFDLKIGQELVIYKN